MERLVRSLNRLTVQLKCSLREDQLDQLAYGIHVAHLQRALLDRSQAVFLRIARDRRSRRIGLEQEVLTNLFQTFGVDESGIQRIRAYSGNFTGNDRRHAGANRKHGLLVACAVF